MIIRRIILLLPTLLIVGLMVYFTGIFKSTAQQEREALMNFLQGENQMGIRAGQVEALLFDVQGKTGTRGRAFYIGGPFFITAYHVVDKGKNLSLVRQARRGPVGGHHYKFEVAQFNRAHDVALLKASLFAEPIEFLPRLCEKVPEKGENVSLFIRLTKGNKKHSGYELEFGGADLYNKKKHVDFLGKLVLPPSSSLYEKQGLVLRYDIKALKLDKKSKNDSKEWAQITKSKDLQYLTSITAYQGESGSPVFVRSDRSYKVCGLLFAVRMTGQVIPTPAHPLNFYAHDRTVSFIIRPEAIKAIIKQYLVAPNSPEKLSAMLDNQTNF